VAIVRRDSGNEVGASSICAMDTPKLIEQGVRNYMQVVLTKCYDHRVQFYSMTLNIVVLIMFLGITGMILWYCHSRQLSPEDKHKKRMKDQEYVLTKIRQFQIHKDQQKSQLSQLIHRVAPAEIHSIPSSSVMEMSQNPADIMYRRVLEE